MNRNTQSNSTKFNLLNKTVVITGASSGAGRATALEFARHGAKIILAARNMEALNEVEAQCREMGALALAVQTDVTDSEAMNNLAATAAEFGGTIDVWVNNAGVLAAGEFSETPIEVSDKVIRVNLMGYIYGAYAVMPYFKKQRRGVLINNISVGGWFPVPYGVGYTASKFGIRGFSQALQGELKKYPRIKVCDMFPAFLDSPGIQHAANYTGRILKPAPPVYDPQQLARAIVSVAQRPKSVATVTALSNFLRLSHFLMPSVSRLVTTKVIESYLDKADRVPETSGNLFAPAPYGTSIHGGWNSAADQESRKKTLGQSLAVLGIATGLFFLGRSKFAGKN